MQRKRETLCIHVASHVLHLMQEGDKRIATVCGFCGLSQNDSDGVCALHVAAGKVHSRCDLSAFKHHDLGWSFPPAAPTIWSSARKQAAGSHSFSMQKRSTGCALMASMIGHTASRTQNVLL